MLPRPIEQADLGFSPELDEELLKAFADINGSNKQAADAARAILKGHANREYDKNKPRACFDPLSRVVYPKNYAKFLQLLLNQDCFFEIIPASDFFKFFDTFLTLNEVMRKISDEELSVLKNIILKIPAEDLAKMDLASAEVDAFLKRAAKYKSDEKTLYSHFVTAKYSKKATASSPSTANLSANKSPAPEGLSLDRPIAPAASFTASAPAALSVPVAPPVKAQAVALPAPALPKALAAKPKAPTMLFFGGFRAELHANPKSKPKKNLKS